MFHYTVTRVKQEMFLYIGHIVTRVISITMKRILSGVTYKQEIVTVFCRSKLSNDRVQRDYFIQSLGEALSSVSALKISRSFGE